MRQSVHLGRLYIRPLYTTISAFRKIIYQAIVYDNQCIKKDYILGHCIRQSGHLGRLNIRSLYTTIRAFRKIIYQDIVYDNQCIQKDWRFVVLYGNQCIQEKMKIRGFHKAISAFRGKCRLGDSIRQPVHLEKIVDQVIPYGNQCIQEKMQIGLFHTAISAFRKIVDRWFYAAISTFRKIVEQAITYGNQCIYLLDDCRLGNFIRQSVH